MINEILNYVVPVVLVFALTATIRWSSRIWPTDMVPPDPAIWDAESLFAGESVQFSSFAVVAPDDRWATGFLYLTNFRLIWIRADVVSAPMFPPTREFTPASVSIRLTHVETVRPIKSKLEITTGDEVYTFAFALYLRYRGFTTGIPNVHKAWLQAIQAQLKSKATPG